MRSIILLSVIIMTCIHAEDFITQFEYGQMLYRNPHGASCAKCHGETGGGMVISEYTAKRGNKVILKGPDIRNATLEQIKDSVKKGKGVMPKYFLAPKEVETIYAYLKSVNRRKKTKISDLFTPAD